MIFIETLLEQNRLFISKVKGQLKYKGWTYYDLEKATGIKKTTIEAYMIGKRDINNGREKIARALGIDECTK